MPLATPFRVSETHRVLGRGDSDGCASSEGYNWTSLYASAQRESPYEGYFPAVKDQLIVLHRTGPASIHRMENDKPVRKVIPAGGIHLVPGGMSFGFRLLDPLQTLHVYVRRAVIEEVAIDMVDGDPTKIEIPPLFVDEDPKLSNLLNAILMALEDSDYATALYVDYLSRAVAAQLLRNHSSANLRPQPALNPTGHIGPSIAEAIAFMRENLEHSISLMDIARAINRSPSHFARQFRNELGMPPHHYLVNLRIEKAQMLLERTKTSIAEIAFECGFSHQEHLTRFFQRRVGTTPAAYRRSKQN
jgi:AraC family transcriptional regulator